MLQLIEIVKNQRRLRKSKKVVENCRQIVDNLQKIEENQRKPKTIHKNGWKKPNFVMIFIICVKKYIIDLTDLIVKLSKFLTNLIRIILI